MLCALPCRRSHGRAREPDHPDPEADPRRAGDHRTELGARIDLTNARLDQTNARLDDTNARLGTVETTLLDLAEQQPFVVRHPSASTERDRRLETDVEVLRARVDAIEERLASRSG